MDSRQWKPEAGSCTATGLLVPRNQISYISLQVGTLRGRQPSPHVQEGLGLYPTHHTRETFPFSSGNPGCGRLGQPLMGQSLGDRPPRSGRDPVLVVSGTCFLISVPSEVMSHPYFLSGWLGVGVGGPEIFHPCQTLAVDTLSPSSGKHSLPGRRPWAPTPGWGLPLSVLYTLSLHCPECVSTDAVASACVLLLAPLPRVLPGVLAPPGRLVNVHASLCMPRQSS